MSYRPICDFWFLARAKLKGGRKYYGAYLGGFPERARVLIGCSITDPVLHVCGGMSRHYPYAGGFGPNDRTLDLDPACEPDFLQDATDRLPFQNAATPFWPGIIFDPPYSPDDAAKYVPGSERYPSPNKLIERGIEAVMAGGRVGIIHYVLPRCPKNAKFIACVGVCCGFNNRIRCFSVFERRS
jgi:hypothetical protein